MRLIESCELSHVFGGLEGGMDISELVVTANAKFLVDHETINRLAMERVLFEANYASSVYLLAQQAQGRVSSPAAVIPIIIAALTVAIDYLAAQEAAKKHIEALEQCELSHYHKEVS